MKKRYLITIITIAVCLTFPRLGLAGTAGYAYAESVDASTTSTTYGDVGSGIADTSFTNGDQYLIMGRASINVDSQSAGFKIRMEHGTTPFAESEMNHGARHQTGYYHYQWFTVWTAVAGEDINFEAALIGSGTTNIDHMTITAINLDDIGTEGTDWFWDENGTDTLLSSSYSTSNNAQITIESGDHDSSAKHLILAYAQVDEVSSTDQVYSEIARTGEATENRPEVREEGEDGTGIFMQYMVLAHDLGASDNTFASRSKTGVGSPNRLHSAIFAMNLDKFTVASHAYTEAELASASTSGWGDAIQTLTHDLSGESGTTANVIISYDVTDHSHANAQAHHRMQIDNSDFISGGSDTDHPNLSWDGTDEIPYGFTTLETALSAASHTIDYDGYVANPSATPGYEDRLIVAFTLGGEEIAPAAGQVIMVW